MNKSYGIHDKWPDLDKENNVLINSIDGVIENISVNGVPAGGVEFTTANVTVNNSNELSLLMNGAFPIEGTLGYDFPFIEYVAFSDEFGTGKVALYKGIALIRFELNDGNDITVSGNAQIISSGIVKITGDCTITVS